MSERDLFLAAIDLTAEDRDRFLNEKCGADAGLRARVDALLASHAAAGSFLAVPADGVTRSATDHAGTRDLGAVRSQSSAAEATGQLIAGRYKLVERIGEGGMGSVWVADQTEPVKRKVAVKLIKVGLDSKQVLARFEAERQALALMDHPNIAKVLDGGVYDGRPYFVMELVKGVPITEFCDARRLTPQQRLELFVPVCQAIQHAHQKGVIHRDVKPANVLVALYDDRPVPKVIDFGVAKATGPTLTEHTLNTGFGGVVGTPQYMSPEQATFNNLDIDTRSDVYSLGVLLYELLAGSPPFKRKELEKRGLLEILRVVREEEPPKPSTKLSTADALPSLSASRGMEPKELTGLLRNELDWVVMKALEKDRTRRYETATGFAADVQRYLAGEPVQAHPPSRSYRVRKFVRRHRGQVTAAGLVLLALLLGITGTTFGLLQARAQTQLAVAEAAAKEDARRSEAEQRELAEQANQQAVAALKSYTDELMGQVLGGRDRLTDTETTMLRNAQKQWDVFARSQGQSPQARDTRALGATQLALIQNKLGLTAEAEANHRTALALRAALAAEFPAVPLYRRWLGMCHQNLGSFLRGSGRRGEAEAEFAQAVEVYTRLVADLPAVPEYRSRLSESYISLGNATRDRGDLANAVGCYRTALGHQQKLVADHPEVTSYRESVARSHWGLAFAKKRLEQLADAETHYRIALATYKELAVRPPAAPDLRRDIGSLHRELGVMLSDGGDHARAEAEFTAALEYQRRLADEFPSIPTYRLELGRTHRDYGRVLRLHKKPAEATEQFGKAEAALERLTADHPTVLPYQADLGLAYLYHGDVYDAAENRGTSLGWYDKALRTLTLAFLTDPKHILIKNSLANSHAARATALDGMRRHVEAVKDWEKAVELAPPNRLPAYRAQRAGSILRVGRVPDAVAEVAELAKSANWSADQWYTFARVYSAASAKVADKKAEYAAAAVEMLQKAVTAGWKDAAHVRADADLDPLRARDDFQKLLADLAAKFPPTREVLPAPRRE